MKTIKEIFRIGYGPSSSHPMAPRFAAERFLKKNPAATSFEVTLYGSLAATGKGHLTDKAILDVLSPHGVVSIVWKPTVFLPFHPNGMRFKAFIDDALVDEWMVYSVGGGALAEEGVPSSLPDIYEMSKMTDIMNWCDRSGKTYWEDVIG